MLGLLYPFLKGIEGHEKYDQKGSDYHFQPREFVGSNPSCFLMRIAMENFGISLLPISPNWLDTVI